MNRIYVVIMLVLINNTSNAQNSDINWSITPDSVTLTPLRFYGNGSITVRGGGKEIVVDGRLSILPREKVLFYQNGENLFKLKLEDISEINMDGYRKFNLREINIDKELYDSILIQYRINIYKSLDLNEVEVLLTKKNKYELMDGDLKVKSPKIVKGKICFLNTFTLVLLTEDGELVRLYDGDYNYLKVGSLKVFECSNLYNFVYDNFNKTLKETIKKWEINLKKYTLRELISLIGPYDKLQIIDSSSKMAIWDKETKNYFLNTNSSTSSYYNSFGLINGKSSTSTTISPIFYYGNDYRPISIETTSTANLTNLTSSKTTSLNSIQGELVSKTISKLLSVVLDNKNKIIDIYQERIFSENSFGLAFKFINY